ncbi:MAG: hypothetical protein ACI80P_001535 [Flavobacteriales bacterium]|jgi:hypothetical protein
MIQGDFAQTLERWNNLSQASPSVYAIDIDPTSYNFLPMSVYVCPIGIRGSQTPHTGVTMESYTD